MSATFVIGTIIRQAGVARMVEIRPGQEGISITAGAYRLLIHADRPYARLEDSDGRWAELCLATDVHSVGTLDETAAFDPPIVDGEVIVLRQRSAAWQSKRLVLSCRDDHLSMRVEVVGRGRLADVHLLGGHVSAYPRWGSGFHASAAAFRTLVSPEPTTPERIAAPASEPATLDVQGSSLPGRGRWFFTPPPFVLAFSRASPPGGVKLPEGPWLSLGIEAQHGKATFTGVHYEVGERTFWLRLAYEGQTEVDGAWSSPRVTFRFGASDPYEAIASHGPAVSAAIPAIPSWWPEPIFCGWGAQCHLATGTWRNAADHSTQRDYDRFLASLEAHEIRPGTIVIDDRWERAYGSGEADAEHWPDLRGWIADRHAAGQRVLLWWKAWAADGVDPALCITNAAGRPIAVDPTNPDYAAALKESLRRMLGADGYDADGLKVDFTALTPSGANLSRTGSAWGVDLLYELLRELYQGAKAAKADALVVTHTPHPAFRDVTDMTRLNDVQRLDDPSPGAPFVEHMVHRARIVRAAMPDVLIDTDNWAMPDLATWRAYLDRQAELGVPSLYYATHIDRSGEALRDEDYAALREAWARYRASLAE